LSDLRSEVDRLRDLLAEARRYVRSDPEEARRLVGRAVCGMTARRVARRDGGRVARLAENLLAGRRSVRAAPHVLEGYIDGASWELLAMVGRIRGVTER
jgi:hypothetical protein